MALERTELYTVNSWELIGINQAQVLTIPRSINGLSHV